ncbi:MAG: hypothetical protein RL708_1629 [Bacteroidota bacterium]
MNHKIISILKKIFFVIAISFLFAKQTQAWDRGFYDIGTATTIGFNMAISAACANQIYDNQVHHKLVPIVGLTSGSIQLAMGIGDITNPEYLNYGIIETSLALITIGLSVWDLKKRSHLFKLNKQTAWNINSMQVNNRNVGVCFSMNHNF